MGTTQFMKLGSNFGDQIGGENFLAIFDAIAFLVRRTRFWRRSTSFCHGLGPNEGLLHYIHFLKLTTKSGIPAPET